MSPQICEPHQKKDDKMKPQNSGYCWHTFMCIGFHMPNLHIKSCTTLGQVINKDWYPHIINLKQPYTIVKWSIKLLFTGDMIWLMTSTFKTNCKGTQYTSKGFYKCMTSTRSALSKQNKSPSWPNLASYVHVMQSEYNQEW